MNDNPVWLDKFCLILMAFLFGLFCGIIGYAQFGCKTSTPVEKNEVIDSLTKINDSIKIKVEHLDSVKNAKVIEVTTLDNDSTLKLFYELVSE